MLDANDIFGDEADETDKKASLWNWLFKAMQRPMPESQYTIESRKRVLESKFAPVGELLTQRLTAGGLIPRGETYHFVAYSKEFYRFFVNGVVEGIPVATELLRKLPLRLWEREEKGSVSDFWEDPDELLIEGSYKIPYLDTARKLFVKMAETEAFFVRGNNVVEINEEGVFETITEQSLRTKASQLFQKISSVNVKVENDRPVTTKKKGNLSRDICAAILAADKTPLQRINIISSCPVLYENLNGEITLCRKGYTPSAAGGVFVTGGESVRPETLEVAVEIVLGLFCDFDFVTESDKTRAIAMAVTVALVQGGFIDGCVPMDYAEANQSQAGKGYRHDLVVAIYNEEPTIVTQRNGGTGSFDESFGSALLRGRPIIRLDNLRGKLDSPALESFLTTPVGGAFHARGFRNSEYVQAGRNIIQASSNGAQGTEDIANRACVIRIKKRPDDHEFKRFDEGDQLNHVRANQGAFLGAVHLIVEEWIKRGKQETNESRHDFRKWVGKLDWIMKNIFGRFDLMDGHRGIQTRVSTPILGVLRDVAIGLDRADRLEEEMGAAELVDFAEACGIDIHGADTEKKSRWLGIQIGRIFKDIGKLNSENSMSLEGYSMTRIIRSEYRHDGGPMEKKLYRFAKCDQDGEYSSKSNSDSDPF